ncbi:MAG: tetratricopeptide repeat protein [Acidobacteria bacterium]|nr:MAG: tetratricopeptide repeat protein [Acidobacteriota bacterium]
MSSPQERARALAVAQNFGPEALDLNRELVTSNPGDLASRTRLARCLLEAGRVEEAEAEYREVLRYDSKSRIAANAIEVIQQQRRRAELAAMGLTEPPRGVSVARAPRRAASPTSPRPSAEPSRASLRGQAVPHVFNGLQRRDFAELQLCPRGEIQERFAPRVLDLIRRVNALDSSREIAGVREPGRRQLFRLGRGDVHVVAGHWFVFNLGGRWEPQFNIGMYGGVQKGGDWLRIGMGFNLTERGNDPDPAEGLRAARDHFRRFQALLGSPKRSLFTGWMIKENGLIQHDDGAGPRLDLADPSRSLDVILHAEPTRTEWVFFGKWLSPDREQDAVVLADPVSLVRTIDRAFIGLLPLWRAMWNG